MNNLIDLGKIKQTMREFAKERDWEQFHSPKNIATALSVETAELLEIFQWMPENDSREIMKNGDQAKKVREEMADIFYYLIRLSDILEIDLEKEFEHKMTINREKYPVSLAKGNALKYTNLK